jgi:hypothetical protein
MFHAAALLISVTSLKIHWAWRHRYIPAQFQDSVVEIFGCSAFDIGVDFTADQERKSGDVQPNHQDNQSPE